MGKRERVRARKRKRVIETAKHKRRRPEAVERALERVTYTDPRIKRILVVGDGDFSFCNGLIQHRAKGQGIKAGSSGSGLVATIYDSFDECTRKYGADPVGDRKARLERAGAQVVDRVDARRLDLLLQRKDYHNNGGGHKAFDRVVFNFPHTGEQRIHLNRQLVDKFFKSCRETRGLLARNAQVHMTVKTKRPYSDWNIVSYANSNGFGLKNELNFDIRLFPGYHHRTTEADAKKFEPSQCKTYVFVLRDQQGIQEDEEDNQDDSGEEDDEEEEEAEQSSDDNEEEEEGDEASGVEDAGQDSSDEEEGTMTVHARVPADKAPVNHPRHRSYKIVLHALSESALRALLPDKDTVVPIGEDAWLSLDAK